MIEDRAIRKATDRGGDLVSRTSRAASPILWSQISSGPQDVRLVVSDMDGTLLTDDGAVPGSFWDLLAVMRERGIIFVPASGRQHASLFQLFGESDDGVSYIAENGNLVIHQGKPLFSISLGVSILQRVVHTARIASVSRNLGLVVCGLNGAYVERSDRAFMREVERYYAKVSVVDDLNGVADSVLKLAIYDFTDAQASLDQIFRDVAVGHQAVISGKHWLDIMSRDVDKGRAVRMLQDRLGINAEQIVVFGDYLNDLQMLDTTRWSFAMSNGHPQVQQTARYLAPSSREHGVIAVLSRLLDVTGY